MLDLGKVINSNTYVASDHHFGHFRVLQFEPIRVEYLSDYNTDVVQECQELLGLYDSIPTEERRNNARINELCKYLIGFHDQMFYEKWNSVVGENDTILMLGDLAFRGIDEHTSKLNGKKILLRGNHDLKSKRTYLEAGWLEVIESVKVVVGDQMFEMVPSPDKYWNGLVTTVDGVRILFSHYPIRNSIIWDIKKYGKITDLLENIFDDFGCEVNIHGHTHSKPSVYEKAINVSIEKCPGLRPIKIGELLELNGFKK